jgi:hypothetical protein
MNFNQISLLGAILSELDRQQPGTMISQPQMNALIGAADLVILAMRDARPYQIAAQVADICTIYQEVTSCPAITASIGIITPD